MVWRPILKQVLAVVYDSLERDKVRWTILGSTATALQGCRVVPNDIDILTFSPDGVYSFAELMSVYTPPKCDYEPGDDNWRSSKELAVSADTWHFGRWYVDGFKVEVAHIAASEGYSSDGGTGIWEAGPEVWPHIRSVPFAGYQVPVVPLEIQLQTNFDRGLDDRINEIIIIFQNNGYNSALIQKCLATKHQEAFRNLMRL